MTFTKIMQALVGSRKAHIENLIVAALMLGVTSAYELFRAILYPTFLSTGLSLWVRGQGLSAYGFPVHRISSAGHGGL